jgi:hypothetical protein
VHISLVGNSTELVYSSKSIKIQFEVSSGKNGILRPLLIRVEKRFDRPVAFRRKKLDNLVVLTSSCFKFFIFIADALTKYARVFVGSMHCQISLIFAAKISVKRLEKSEVFCNLQLLERLQTLLSNIRLG